MTRLADWLPEPLTVPTRIARSLIVGAIVACPARTGASSTTERLDGMMSLVPRAAEPALRAADPTIPARAESTLERFGNGSSTCPPIDQSNTFGRSYARGTSVTWHGRPIRRTVPRGRGNLRESPARPLLVGFERPGWLSALKTCAIWGSGSRTMTTKTPALRYSATLSRISSQRSFSEQTSTTSSGTSDRIPSAPCPWEGESSCNRQHRLLARCRDCAR